MNKPDDEIKAAIDAVAAGEPQPIQRTVQMMQVNITVAPEGRPAVLACPVDWTDTEIRAFVNYVTGDEFHALRLEQMKPKSKLDVIRAMPAGLD